jgi:hypothetical protein
MKNIGEFHISGRILHYSSLTSHPSQSPAIISWTVKIIVVRGVRFLHAKESIAETMINVVGNGDQNKSLGRLQKKRSCLSDGFDENGRQQKNAWISY